DFGFNIQSPLAAKIMQSRAPGAGSASDVDANFLANFGAPADGKALILPLLLKDKVSALVYADAGTEDGPLDSAALDVCVRATSAWMEVVSQRKQAQREGAPEPDMHSAAPTVNDPFAAHAPIHNQAVEAAPPAAMSAAAAWGGAQAAAVPTGEDAE